MKMLNIVLVINIIVLILISILMCLDSKKSLKINNEMIKNKYNELVSLIGQPTYKETDANKNLKSATWMVPLEKKNQPLNAFKGCDYIKILGSPSKKYHPYPADVFLIVGKYIKVPEHLFGPLKYASETINIEQLLIPKKYADKYYNTGEKELALLTGSCASVTISVITIQFAIDMINIYGNETNKSLELYELFRNEYDRRINDYLCNNGITDEISWFNNNDFNEPDKMSISICK